MPALPNPRATTPHPSEGNEDTASLPRFLTRHPLLDGEYRVIGYELGVNERAPLPVLPGATSPSQIRDENLLTRVIDEHYRGALCRKLTLLSLESLDSPLLEHLPPENTILAVPPRPASPELLARCQALVRLGFTLSLEESSLSPGIAPLARQCGYLRLDVGDGDLMGLCDRLARIQGIKGPRLIARNVPSEESFAACRKLSFDLYQGDFLTQPTGSAGKHIDGSRLLIMKLLNLVLRHAEYAELEAQFKLDAGLSYKLLRYINSPAVGLRYPIRSINHVLLMLGHDQLYRWLTLLLFAHAESDGRSQALLRHALVRARFAEALGEERMPPELRGGLFITGILSLLDALLDLPMAQAIAALNLAQPIVDALLHGDGPYGPYLDLVKACERFDQLAIGQLAGELGMGAETVNLAHVNALIWQEGLDL